MTNRIKRESRRREAAKRLSCSLALIAAPMVAANCARLASIGQPPEFSPPPEPVILATSPQMIAPAGDQIVAASLPPPAEPPRGPVAGASLWAAGRASLLGDRRAQRTGDIVTVVIEIDDEASISNATSRNRSASEDLSVTSLLGLPKVVSDATGVDLNNAAQLSSGSGTSGDGSVRRAEEVTLRLAATVIDVLPNGHFIIVGSQEIRVNYELRDLTVRGVIRPEDISRANEITYDKIAQARVSYGGRGVISDVQQPRYGQQIAVIILPF